MSYNHFRQRYQLISPVVGNKIYQTSTAKKGAKKCYHELKGYGPIRDTEFSVLNLDSYETYKFKIDKLYSQRGGNDGEEVHDDPSEEHIVAEHINDDKQIVVPTGDDKKIIELEDRIRTLENKVNYLESQLKEKKSDFAKEVVPMSSKDVYFSNMRRLDAIK
jgi:hypothetical protein